MADDIQIESFAAWVLAAQIAAASGVPAGPPPETTATVPAQTHVTVDALMRQAHSRKKECVILADANDQVIGYAWGDVRGATLDAKDLRLLTKPGNYTLIHNHPGGSSFSAGDLDTFLRFPGIQRMVVKVHDGTEYQITNVKPGAVQAYKKLDDKFYRQAHFVKQNRAAAVKGVAHRVMLQLHKDGLLNYSF
jgi:hypothetical protein